MLANFDACADGSVFSDSYGRCPYFSSFPFPSREGFVLRYLFFILTLTSTSLNLIDLSAAMSYKARLVVLMDVVSVLKGRELLCFLSNEKNLILIRCRHWTWVHRHKGPFDATIPPVSVA